MNKLSPSWRPPLHGPIICVIGENAIQELEVFCSTEDLVQNAWKQLLKISASPVQSSANYVSSQLPGGK